ncbi:MAG TPA: hypothetical protein DIC34_11680 [Treponema sp.]|nr:MAG: hypothetical protein A2001_10955 [Treponema sp. GWC1_61_84]OHE73512.1 MAG: hypothetical protein A2413_16645 [Treponema sp. RIFOXYC1_FULL_61_9]HCM27185.1 hypothetical protein [Treponema sp.]
MITSKTSARITGVLFILGTVPILIALALWGRPLLSPDYLSLMAANRGQILLFVLTIMIMGFSCAGIGISLYPVLSPHDKGLALTAMGFRLMEGPLEFVFAIGYVALLAVSQEFVEAGSPPDSYYQGAGAAIKAVIDWVGRAYYLPFCIGAFSYYTIFYNTRLVPRWLSVWGLGGILLMLVSSLGGILGLIAAASPVGAFLCMPILVQELVLAVRLIVKGFDTPAAAAVRTR